MRKVIDVAMLAVFCLGMLTATAFVTPATAQNPGIGEEKAEHPRIAKAIRDLEDAIRYMRNAPHDFGGHKQEAIEASENAIRELKLALAYRAKQERHSPQR
ncbi:MAG: hypothetical protein ABSC55_18610 [Syntrophorhabdales bacterium]|jgi:hypothetical protein